MPTRQVNALDWRVGIENFAQKKVSLRRDKARSGLLQTRLFPRFGHVQDSNVETTPMAYR